jgi:hypothetical protein
MALLIFGNFDEKDTPVGVFFYGTLGQCQQVLFVIQKRAHLSVLSPL